MISMKPIALILTVAGAAFVGGSGTYLVIQSTDGAGQQKACPEPLPVLIAPPTTNEPPRDETLERGTVKGTGADKGY